MAHYRSRRGWSPFRLFATVGVIFTVLATLLLDLGLALPWLWAYLVGVNLAALLAYFYDKQAAVRSYRRVPENVLHLLAAAGGSPAAVVSQAAFRHKTTKPSFRLRFWAIFIAQGVLLTAWLMYARPWR